VRDIARSLYLSKATIIFCGGIIFLVSMQAYASERMAEGLGWREIALICIGLLTTVVGAYMKGLEKSNEQQFSNMRSSQAATDVRVAEQQSRHSELERMVLKEFHTKPELMSIITNALAPIQQSIGRIEGAVESLHKRVDRLQGRRTEDMMQ